MTKKELIWLVIRFLGIFKLILSPRFILEIFSSFWAMLIILPANSVSTKVVFVSSFLAFLEGVFYVLTVVYLIFFGKTVFNVIHRTSGKMLDTVLEKQDYAEILIRFIGSWWVWKGICRVFGILYSGFMMLIFSHPKWFLPETQLAEAKKLLEEFMELLRHAITWSAPASLLLYAILAFYFLKHGKFFINLLNRLWRKEANQNLIQNPDSPV